ncbi:MAG TPA: hypothetical protein VMW38_05275 [Terriglobia bacterium]|nr:hypothetical protein [Terriglobia bacterium]
MEVIDQARRLAYLLTGIDDRMLKGGNDREVYEFLEQFGNEFDVDLNLVDMRHLSHYRWVIPLRNYTGVAVVVSRGAQLKWEVYDFSEIPQEIGIEIKRCARRQPQSA